MGVTLKTHRGKLVVDFRDPATGVRTRVVVPEGETSARRAAAFERKVLAGWRPPKAERAPTSVPTLAEHWPKFMEFQASPANKRPNRPRTIAELQRVYDNYLEVELGGTRLDMITTSTVDVLAGAMHKRELSAATIGNVLGALRRALNVAKRWGLIDAVPEIDAAKPKSQNAIDPEHWLTKDELLDLLEHAGDWRPLVLFMARTGLRMGEVQALRFQDVTSEGVHVRRSWSEALGAFGPTKSGRSRLVPITKEVDEAVAAAIRPTEPLPFGPKLIFASANGRPLNPTSFARALRRAAKAAGLTKHVHPHMLRHTFASHCIAAGIPSRVLMAWGGWESEAMLARYAHLAPREIEHWAAMLPGAVG